jgi:hypothetical protein
MADLISYLWTCVFVMVTTFNQLPNWSIIFGGLVLLPTVSALPNTGIFPDIPFRDFSQFIHENLGSDITLSQVLTILFTLTENTDLLSLHARQQNPKYSGEGHSSPSVWIKCLARGLQERLGTGRDQLYYDQETAPVDAVNKISTNLDALAKILGLYPYDPNGKFKGKLKPILNESIQPVHIICPDAAVCQTASCKPRSLVMGVKLRDIPRVTLIKGCTTYANVQVLTGQCPKCKTLYSADHERVTEPGSKYTRVYLNGAKYLKVGQALWVDRVFAGGVVNGVYSFHASAAAYTEYWNNSFSSYSENPIKVSRRQTWQAFVQETIRSIAASSNVDVELQDGLAIDDVTKQAFELLGEDGIIRLADQHACEECTQPYRHTSDRMPNIDPAAVVGVDENRRVPRLAQGADLTNPGLPNQLQVQTSSNDEIDIGDATVNMVVVDGIVMGPTVCKYTS